MKTVTVRISDELHKRFKIMMVLDNKTMNDRIIELISSDIERFDKGVDRSNKSIL